MFDERSLDLDEQKSATRLNPFIHILEKDGRLQYVLLAVVTLLALGLRLYKLAEWSFWRDELATINRALGHFNIETIINQWWRPPLSVILTGGFLNHFGVNEWFARIPSVVIGVLSILLIFFVAKRLSNGWVGLLASIMVALSTWHIFWSQNARFYTSLMLLYFLASFLFYIFIERGHLKYLVLFAFIFFLAMSERLNAILLIPVLIFYLVLLFFLPWKKPAGFNLRNLSFLVAPGVAIVLLELYSLVSTSTTRIGFAFETFFGKPIDDPVRILILILFSIGVPLAVLAFFSGFSMISERNRLGLYLLLNATIPIGILLAGSPFIFTVERYAFITLPSWILLASYGIWEITRKVQFRPYLIGACLLFMIIGDMSATNLMYYQINHGNRQDWRQAMQIVTHNASTDDVIVSSVAELGSYYTGREVLWLGDIDPEMVKTFENRHWFVIDSENGWWSPNQKSWVENNAILIDELYLRVQENMNIRIYLYSQDEQNPLR
jgi:mannosyltransferase